MSPPRERVAGRREPLVPGLRPAIQFNEARPGTAWRGFSLIELVVVLVLMAMLASTAAISVRGVIVRQRLSRAAEVVEQFDTALRRMARYRRRSVAGVVDRGGQRLTVDPSGKRGRMFKLSKHVTIDTIRIGPSIEPRSGNRILAGSDGQCPSYAIRLTSGETSRWILFVGGSGQVLHGLSTDSINSLLAAQ